ncbi:divalent-cation tolerance protein CutA [Polynucleobacter sp. MWH-Jannik1A5]|jgi:periplasmic divalent cation tolerance protein|uniref:divalent-cation tolerance protein CutA n=1 Tax=Polynucleobacter sp. MWH-Jannik1A5 TaxID=1855890 RepID=UPI001C0CB2AD|nr:divalent-cation tolerance protein CutA [Polynucleobacter sp. MWH-Jannik1A5]MBU3546473.1 divalent-cation tolerance protein CutA [Polynucleobacter sp. MWH-Jannik1A5]
MSKNIPVNHSKLLVVVTSLPSLDAAKGLARALVEQNLAACAQLTEGIHSIYRWEGKICEEQEVLLSAKTIEAKWLEILAFIQSAHPYDLPEILAFSPEQHERQYGAWVESEVNSKS